MTAPLFQRVMDPADAKAGDVFWTTNKGWLDRLIRIFTTSRVSHVGLIAATSAPTKGVWTTHEAFADGLLERRRNYDDPAVVTILRLPGNPDEGLARSWQIVDSRYDFRAVWRLAVARLKRSVVIGPFLATVGFFGPLSATQLGDLGWWVHIGWVTTPILLLGVRALFPTKIVLPSNNEGRWFCNEHIHEYFRSRGHDLGTADGWSLDPGDLLAEALAARRG